MWLVPEEETRRPLRELGEGVPIAGLRRPAVSPCSATRVLALHSRFVGRVFEAGGHATQHFRGSLDVTRVHVIKEVTANTREVHRPCGPQFGHAQGSDLRDIAPRVSGARRLRHESARLKIVDQARRPARRKVGGARQVGHSQLAIWGFREVHDRRVLARGQADTPDEVAVEESRENLENTHLGTPESLFTRRKWFDGWHLYNLTCLAKQHFALTLEMQEAGSIVSSNEER
jgi:hypothetical protein